MSLGTIADPINVLQVGRNTTATSIVGTIAAVGVAVGFVHTVHFACPVPNAAAATCVDSKGNTYVNIKEMVTGIRTVTFAGLVTTALVTGDTVTVQTGATTQPRAAMSTMKVMGITTTKDTVSNSATAASTAPASGAIVPTIPHQLLIGTLAAGSISGNVRPTLTPATGWTAGGNAASAPAAAGFAVTECWPMWRIISTYAAPTGTYNDAGSFDLSRTWSSTIAALRAISNSMPMVSD